MFPRLRGTSLALYIRGRRTTLDDSKLKLATWFEHVGDDDLIAFSRPLLSTFAQPVAVGELVGGPLAGTVVLVRIQPEEPEPAKRPAEDPEPARRRTDEVRRTR
jgi:hypothetical protein